LGDIYLVCKKHFVPMNNLYWNKSPFEVILVDPIPLSDRISISSSCILNMNAFARMNESYHEVTISTFFKSNLKISLMSMSIFIPN